MVFRTGRRGCCSAPFNESVARPHESAARLFVCIAHKINYRLSVFLHDQFFMEKYFAAPALSWYTSARSRVKKTLMFVFGLGSNAIAEELTMATDKDTTTTRTAKDAAEDVTRAT